MPYCSKCKQTRHMSKFWINRKKNKPQSYCKDCSNDRRRQYYQDNKDKEHEIRRNRDNRHRKWLQDYKKKCLCTRCEETRWYVLDFHHTSGKKEHNVSDMCRWSISRIRKEIEKCIVVCANCHREIHFEDRSSSGLG